MGLFRRRRSVPPRLVIDKTQGDPAAARLRAAMTRRDWPGARAVLESAADPDHKAFCLSVCGDVPGVQDWIPDVAAAEPGSTLPLLVRGAHGVAWAWEARGAKRAEHTQQEQFREFFKRLRMAENCLDEVVERDPEDAAAWAFLVTSARGRQVDRDEAQRRFDGAVKRWPHHRMAHEQMLQHLCQKWFGSHQEMFDFARLAASSTPPGSGLAHLVAVAHIEQWLDLPVGEDAEYMAQPQVVDELHAAADASVRHPDFQRRPGWPVVPNVFAFAYACAGQWAAAAEQFDLIGDLATDWPWGYLRGDEVGEFLEMREAAWRHRGRAG